MNPETKICQNCKNQFTIEPEDFKFYEKISVPPPTFCPECRSQRRMTWRDERSLYQRKDDFGKDIISIYSSDKPFKIYPRDYWWSDAWNAMNYGNDYDFSKTFFIQFRQLLESVPLSAVFSNNVVNSPYVNHVGFLKNCYLTFASWECENVHYSNKILGSRDSMDLFLADKCELCYWLIDCDSSYNLFFSQNSSGNSNSFFLFDCKNCQNCFGCVGLRNKQYYIFNEPNTKEEYEKRLKEFDIGSFKNFRNFRQKFSSKALQYPHRFAHLINSPETIGDNCRNVKNCYWCFDLRDNVEDSKYSIHGGVGMKDSYDGYGVGMCELLYEGIDSGVGGGSREKFSVVVYSSNDTDYCFNCEGSSNLFGCIGLRNKQYCILNKQYTKEEYEELVPKIIQHMNDMPYTDKKGRVYKYGEFFPSALSPFAYNETIAQEYFPLTKEEAIEQGYSWKDPEPRNYEITLKTEDITDHIKDVEDSILGQVIECQHKGACNEQCTEAFRIIPQELDFLRKQNLPIPRLCPNCRHYQRIKQRNPLKLWHRKCMCGTKTVYKNTIEHEHKAEPCPNEFETTYAPERPEIVYCEQCYLKEVV